MTAPMTHTLTPREKVERALYLMDDWRLASPEYLIDNILTALASGSGDHAELARLAEAASEVVAARDALTAHTSTWKRLDKATVAYSNAVNRVEPATALALLAENAALRASVVKANDGFEEYERRFYLEQDRATEAERKLAEAREIASKLSAAISWLDYPFIDNNTSEDELRSRVGFMMKDAEQPRAMLCEEAERG